MSKRQVWFSQEQVELTVECLKLARSRLDEGTVISGAHKMAGRYVSRRIGDLLELLEPKAGDA